MAHTLRIEEDVPLLRGVLHAVSCPLTLIVGAFLASLAPTPRASLALIVMSIGFAAIFGTSSIYHRVRWSPQARRRMRQLDHSMIFLGMATAYTSIWLVALDGWISDAVLVYCWIAATVGVLMKLLYLDARPSRHVIGYIAFALVGFIVIPSLWSTMGATGVAMMLLGGFMFIAGAVAFACGRPNLVPGWFGYHELFHAGTVIGCGLFLGALANYVMG
ncbi:MAG: hemolysin III family protein [Gaiellales bacterium]